MTQPRAHSIIEAVANVAIGAGVSLAAQLTIFPALGIAVSFHQNLQILVAFTAVSIGRQYVMRRLFNRWRR